MTRIAFVGLGVTGSPMACNLVRAGYDVVGFTRTPEKARPLSAAGGQVASALPEAVEGAGVVITMLPDSPDVRSVMFAADGVLAAPGPDRW